MYSKENWIMEHFEHLSIKMKTILSKYKLELFELIYKFILWWYNTVLSFKTISVLIAEISKEMWILEHFSKPKIKGIILSKYKSELCELVYKFVLWWYSTVLRFKTISVLVAEVLKEM